MARAIRHVHKYHRINSAYTKLWACAHSECYHHMPKHLEEMVLGRASICWNCDSKMVLDEESMKMDKPFCFKCLHPEIEDEETKMLREYVNSLPDERK